MKQLNLKRLAQGHNNVDADDRGKQWLMLSPSSAFLSPVQEFESVVLLPPASGLKNLFDVSYTRVRLGGKHVTSAECFWDASIGPQIALHVITLRCRLQGNSTPAAAFRRGADSSEALDDAKFSDGLYQVERLRIARTWTDPNTETRVTTFSLLITIKSTASHRSFTGTICLIVCEFGTLKVRRVRAGSRRRNLSFGQLRNKQEFTNSACFEYFELKLQYGTSRLQILHRSAGDFPARWRSGHVSENGRMFHSSLRCPHSEKGGQSAGMSSFFRPGAGEVNTPFLAPKPLWRRGAGVRDG